MSEKNDELIRDLLAIISNHGHGDGCGCSPPNDCCASCTTTPSLEATAVRTNDRSAFLAAESMQNFVDRQSSFHAHSMSLLNDFRVKPV